MARSLACVTRHFITIIITALRGEHCIYTGSIFVNFSYSIFTLNVKSLEQYGFVVAACIKPG